MAIKRRNKPDAAFSMSSMTDLVFLLLIFFMLTSTLVNPNALDLLLPKSNNRTNPEKNSVIVSIDKRLVYYLDAKVVPFHMLERKIVDELKGKKDACVNIQADKSVPVDYVVRVMNISKTYGYKSILSTAPN